MAEYMGGRLLAAQQSGGTIRRNRSLWSETDKEAPWPTTEKRSAPDPMPSRSTRRLPGPDRASRTMRWRRARKLPEPPSDEEVEKVAEALGAPTAENDTLPLEGE